MTEAIQRMGRRVFALVEQAFDVAFGPRFNPFYHLGALSFFFFWVISVSGIYVYIFFETSLEGAYRSVEYLTHEQWYLGGVARSLHRYASDAMVITVMLHLAREFVMDRYRGVRWYAWVTGVALIWLLYASGIGGYWLVWDRLAQYIAVATSEWFDWLGIFGEAIARNFLDIGTMDDRFFSLMAFMHIGIPLFLLLGMWIHIQRISGPKTNPPRTLMSGTLLALIALSFAYPAMSQAPADLATVVSTVHPDWFFLVFYPLIDIWSPGAVWALAGASTLLLLLLPWMPRRHEQAAAVVSLPNCNGCGRCSADCPYSAVIMQPRTDGQPFAAQAVVDPGLCTACGICTAACPTATPFRRVGELLPGIDMPAFTLREMRDRTVEVTAPLRGDDRILVYGCRSGPDLAPLQSAGVATVVLPCVGALPPSFIDFAINRHHADGVVLAGCIAGDCQQRLGVAWTEQRMAGSRDPQLRRRVPRHRLLVLWPGSTGADNLAREIESFRARLRGMGPYRRDEGAPPAAPGSSPAEKRDVNYRVG